MLINALRCHLAEFGIVAAQKRIGLAQLVAVVRDGAEPLRLLAVQGPAFAPQ